MENNAAPVILDQRGDTAGTETHRLELLCPAPDFVKKASFQERAEPADSLPHLYADPRRRLYACHTPAAVWESARFFADKAAQFKPAEQDFIRNRIRATAGFFGILPEVEQVFDKLAAAHSISEEALTDDDFALIWRTELGWERHYPLRNAIEVKTAAEWLHEYRDELTYGDRRQIASNVLRKAAEFKVDLGEHQNWLDRLAGRGIAPLADVIEAWQKRATLTRRNKPVYAQHAEKMATALQAVTLRQVMTDPNDFIEKVALAMDAFDHLTHLNRLYKDGLDRPEDVLFAVTTKTAGELRDNYVPTTTGKIYDLAALLTVPLDKYAEWLGEDIRTSISEAGLLIDRTKLAEIIPTLPRPDAALLDRLLASHGIQPVATEKAAVRLTRQELEAWAALDVPGESAAGGQPVAVAASVAAP